MALAYTAPTWEDGEGTGISAVQLQAISNCIEGLVQGSDKAIHSIGIDSSVLTVIFADGTQETSAIDVKGIVSITKTATVDLVDTYTIQYSDGTTDTFDVTNGSVPIITADATADATSSDNPTVTVTKTGTDTSPVFSFAFSGLKGAQGIPGPQGPAGSGDMDTSDYDPDDTVADAGGIVDYVAAEISGKADDTDLDDWTTSVTASTSGSDVVAVFDDLDNAFGYDLYCEDELIGVTAMTKDTGTNTGIKLTFTLSGATAGTTVCYLRILK